MKSTPIIVVLSVALAGSVAGNALQHFKYSTSRPVLTFAGKSLTKKEYMDHLEYLYGKPVLTRIFLQKLIQNAAQQAGVLATDKDIDDRMAEMDKRNPAALAEAKSDSSKLAEAREELKTDISLENLRMQGVTASDAEVAAFYEKNKAAFAEQKQANVTLVVAGNSVDAETAKTLLMNGMKPEAVARQPRLRVAGMGGFNLPPLPPAIGMRLKNAVSSMKTGDVTVLPVEGMFFIIRADNVAQAGAPPLDSIKPLVARIVRLSKAPPGGAIVSRLYKDAHVTFEVDRYAPWFSNMEEAASHVGSTSPAGTPGATPPTGASPAATH